MVLSIARQSVIIKCNMQSSVITGNYELYYIAGLLVKLRGIAVSADMKPEELLEAVQEQTKEFHSEDAREEYLFRLVQNYRPDDAFDEQTAALFEMGKNEERLWKI